MPTPLRHRPQPMPEPARCPPGLQLQEKWKLADGAAAASGLAARAVGSFRRRLVYFIGGSPEIATQHDQNVLSGVCLSDSTAHG
jgi:hypothetical protein